MPMVIPPVTASGVLRFAWIDPTGTEHDLTFETSPNRFVSRGSTGLGMAAIELALDKLPFASGSLVRHANVPPRRIDLPITIVEDSFGDLIQTVDALAEWFGTGDERRLEPGYLKITRQDGSVRKIAAYYNGGLEGDLRTGAPHASTWVVSLLCPDPWPTADADVGHDYALADFGAEIILINPGDLDAYPIWTIRGPCSLATPSIRVRNTVTLDEFSFNFDLVNHDIGVIVDTRPASIRPNVAIRRYPDDLNIFNYLNADDSLWWLAPGENRFRIDIVGATSSTTVELRYLPRYRSVLR